MESETRRQFRMFLFPHTGTLGHLIPIVDMAKQFASRGLKTTIVTTPSTAPLFSEAIDRNKRLGIEIGVLTIKFPAEGVGLNLLEQPLRQLLQEHRPDCLVADMFFPWAVDVGNKYGIPTLVFNGSCLFSLCASHCVVAYEPHKKVSSDSELFTIPSLPGEIKLTKKQLPDFITSEVETEFGKWFKAIKDAERRSYGVIVNSFYELEPAYADYYRKVLGRKAWHVGPVSLCNKDAEEKALRGSQKVLTDHHQCLKWLESKKPGSVVYACFGSVANFNDYQLKEIAKGLEASGQQFIWVVKKGMDGAEKEEWLPEGFEKRMEEKGLIVRGWAPQLLILDHEAVGGFVTHCGWNSTLEGVAAGVPMVTWPVSAEQFYNEKLVTQVLKIGVGVGAQRWVRLPGDHIKKEALEKAVKQIMVGEEANEMRNRAKALGEMARRAIEEGGSSYSDLTALIEELKAPGC
ncbi:Scopoletin glucosyltransferase [Morella rubra]|uniref:Glycosyltransferase n=1 Tax=Morella rubra TaxID=262757 RepID=A0A6A1V741_9ROSI|nr:Scopoletin glucosyltransferase [Morella rubra]